MEGDVLPARKLQRAHQEEPHCAQCHRKIDPIGYGLENFNAAGEWRDVETIMTGRKKNRPNDFAIDSRGQLPDGTEFADYRGLREAVAGKIDQFAHGFMESLITYGLGRPYGFTDEVLADTILNQARVGDYELSLFIHALVQTDTFQSK